MIASDSDISEAKIRKYAEKKLQARTELRIHTLAFLVFNPMLVAIWWMVTGGDFSFPWFLIPLMGWSIGLFAHYMQYSTKYGRGREKREEFIAREMERERARMYATEKPKNDFGDARGLRLTEDGELSESFIHEDGVYDEQRR